MTRHNRANSHELTFSRYYGMRAGMATMIHRTTFALDEATTQRIRGLASQWQVSQAEVIRRVVAAGASAATTKSDPVTMLNDLHRTGAGLTEKQAQAYLAEVRNDRQNWRKP